MHAMLVSLHRHHSPNSYREDNVFIVIIIIIRLLVRYSSVFTTWWQILNELPTTDSYYYIIYNVIFQQGSDLNQTLMATLILIACVYPLYTIIVNSLFLTIVAGVILLDYYHLQCPCHSVQAHRSYETTPVSIQIIIITLAGLHVRSAM